MQSNLAITNVFAITGIHYNRVFNITGVIYVLSMYLGPKKWKFVCYNLEFVITEFDCTVIGIKLLFQNKLKMINFL